MSKTQKLFTDADWHTVPSSSESPSECPTRGRHQTCVKGKNFW